MLDTYVKKMNYIKKVALMFDEFINSIFDGKRNETISSRAGHAKKEGKLWGCVLCGFLDLFQKGHCEMAVAYDDVVINSETQADQEVKKIEDEIKKD